MKNDNLKYGAIGLLLGGLLFWFATGSTVAAHNFGMMGRSMMNGSMAGEGMHDRVQAFNHANIEAHFMENMVDHHQEAIEMAKLALERSNRQEVKDLAKNIISTQTKEVNQMKDWYKEWFGTSLTEDHEMDHMGMMNGAGGHMGMMSDDLSSLDNAADFDRQFAEEMIFHHRMAITMARMIESRTDRPELKELAKEIVNNQTQEVSQLRTWL